MAGRSGRRKKKRGGRQRRRNPVAELTDDLLVEILSCVPYKSLCRFKCVSRRWSELISHPDHRRKLLPQSLVGFFFTTHDGTCSPPKWDRHFVNVSSSRDPNRPFIHPSLSFLPNPDYKLLLCCNGLVLCCYSQPDATDTYIVVNPATEKWVDVPVSPSWSDKPPTIIRLGFDPAISSHFHVFAFHIDSEDDSDGIVLGVDIYSSKTRLWSYKPCGFASEIWMSSHSISRSVFLDGMLYMVALRNVVVAVDVEGKTWRVIAMPPSSLLCVQIIDLSQERLHVTMIDNDDDPATKLSIWILDLASEEWTLKHEVSFMHLQKELHPSFIMGCIHPERNLMFFLSGEYCTLLSYDMDTRDVRAIRDLGQTCDLLVPYVPLFSESLAHGK